MDKVHYLQYAMEQYMSLMHYFWTWSKNQYIRDAGLLVVV